jgi:hypothetical protein
MDLEDPHSINNVFVDFLGHLEILLFVCDDGDVFGYYTRKIEAAINQAQESDQPASEVDEFFSHNVGMSAWGISIHSKSRKIAVSANTKQVTIFPFGLAQKSSDSADEESELPDDLEYLPKTVLNDPRVRHNDQKFILHKMNHNIPSIAFCNNEDDPDGKIIASGEILGNIFMWDLLDMKPTELMRAEFCQCVMEMAKCECARPQSFPHAGKPFCVILSPPYNPGSHFCVVWCLAWLDRRSFRKLPGPFPDLNGNMARAWNGSAMRLFIPDSRPTYLSPREREELSRTHLQAIDGAGDINFDNDDSRDHAYSETDEPPYFEISRQPDGQVFRRMTSRRKGRQILDTFTRKMCEKGHAWIGGNETIPL